MGVGCIADSKYIAIHRLLKECSITFLLWNYLVDPIFQL